MSKKKTCLVTGATGAVGPSLVWHLVEEGYQVRVLIRPESDIRLLPEDIISIIGDINDQERVARAVSGADYVFHLAAKLHINNPDPSLLTEYERINVAGTETIVDASAAASIQRLIFFSTINVYGTSQDGDILNENSPLKPGSIYAETKTKAEKIVLNARRESDGKAFSTVLRSAAVYGPQMKGNYTRVVRGLKQGWFYPIGKSINRRTIVFDQDLVRAAVIAATHPDSVSEIFNVTDGHIYTLKEIMDAICIGLGKRPPRFHFPLLPFRAAAYLLELSFGLFGKRSPITRDTIDTMLEDRAVSGDKIHEELGFKPNITLGAGWGLTVKGILERTQT